MGDIDASSVGTISDSASASASVDFVAPDEDHRFELKDLNIRFPEGELTVVTGPTASGKTALLVCCAYYHYPLLLAFLWRN